MAKVYLSPSNQNNNKCKQGDSERDHCNLIVDALIPYLEACGIEYVRAGVSQKIADRVKASNKFKADLHYCIHTNAGGGKRSVLYGWDKTASKWLALAEAIKKRRSAVYSGEIRFAQNRKFYEITQTKALCMYDEVLFHDNAAEAKLLHSNVEGFARCIAQGLCDWFGLEFKEPGAGQNGAAAEQNVVAEQSESLAEALAEAQAAKKALTEAKSRLAAIKELAEGAL